MTRPWILLLLISFGAVGCNRSDGDRLARVGQMVAGKVDQLIPERTPFNAALPIPVGNTLELRVKERIKGDKYLGTLPIEVIADGTTVHLKGSLSEELLKKRAIDLAESTVGVEQVIDELEVEAS